MTKGLTTTAKDYCNSAQDQHSRGQTPQINNFTKYSDCLIPKRRSGAYTELRSSLVPYKEFLFYCYEKRGPDIHKQRIKGSVLVEPNKCLTLHCLVTPSGCFDKKAHFSSLKSQCHEIFNYFVLLKRLYGSHMNRQKRFCDVFRFCKDIHEKRVPVQSSAQPFTTWTETSESQCNKKI